MHVILYDHVLVYVILYDHVLVYVILSYDHVLMHVILSPDHVVVRVVYHKTLCWCMWSYMIMCWCMWSCADWERGRREKLWWDPGGVWWYHGCQGWPGDRDSSFEGVHCTEDDDWPMQYGWKDCHRGYSGNDSFNWRVRLEEGRYTYGELGER